MHCGWKSQVAVLWSSIGHQSSKSFDRCWLPCDFAWLLLTWTTLLLAETNGIHNKVHTLCVVILHLNFAHIGTIQPIASFSICPVCSKLTTQTQETAIWHKFDPSPTIILSRCWHEKWGWRQRQQQQLWRNGKCGTPRKPLHISHLQPQPPELVVLHFTWHWQWSIWL